MKIDGKELAMKKVREKKMGKDYSDEDDVVMREHEDYSGADHMTDFIKAIENGKPDMAHKCMKRYLGMAKGKDKDMDDDEDSKEMAKKETKKSGWGVQK